MVTREPDAAEALRCWAHILSDRPPAELEELLRGWFLGEGEPRRGAVGAVSAVASPALVDLAAGACIPCAGHRRGQRRPRGCGADRRIAERRDSRRARVAARTSWPSS